MRILIFTLQFPPEVGGMQTMGFQLSRYLKRAGADVTVLTLDSVGALEFDSDQEIQIERMPLDATDSFWDKFTQKIRLGRELSRILNEVRPSCILCLHWDPCAFIARAAIRWTHRAIPYYLVTHGMELFQLPAHQPSRGTKSQFRLFALRGARKIFAVSHFTKDRVTELGIPPNQIMVIPNGVEVDEPSPGMNNHQQIHSPRILLTVSRLVPRKAHDFVLRALSKVIEKIPDVVYRIVGTGVERERLEQLAQNLGLQTRVEFYGEVSEQDKMRLLKECDLFVLPCRASPTDFEGFGLAYLEAMQYGKPVIGARSGGVPDVIHHGETGLLVKPDDVDGLARAIISILECPDEAKRLGENARRAVREKYRWDLIAEKYLAALAQD